MEYTAREVAMRERAAFCSGAANARINLHIKLGFKYSFEATQAFQKQSREEAEITYPLPKVRRNRTVVLESGVMRCTRKVEWDQDTGFFKVTFSDGSSAVTPHIYQVLMWGSVSYEESEGYWDLLKDLQQNPTELVDAE
jgi:hypothetical protein